MVVDYTGTRLRSRRFRRGLPAPSKVGPKAADLSCSPSSLRRGASTERRLSPRLDFFRRQVLQVRCDCPDEPERVFQFAVAVAPELIPYWRYDFATSRDGLRPRSIGIR